MSLSTRFLTDRVRFALAFLSDQGFQYFRSYKHFRRVDACGWSHIAIHPVFHHSGLYDLAFYISTRIDPLETTIKQVLGQPTKLSHYDRSIWNYTVNIGPTSPHWAYPLPGWWHFLENQDIDNQLAEITAFVCGLVLPFLAGHTTSATVRQTLLETPGHAQNLRPFQQILAADILAEDVLQFEADYGLLSEWYAGWSPPYRAEFEGFYLRAKSFLQHRHAY